MSSLNGLTSNNESKRLARDNPQSDNKETLSDFMSYVDGLLSYKNGNVVASRIIRSPSPSSPPEFLVPSNGNSARSSCRESVDLAIQRNSISADGIALNNMYEIARNKLKIASVVLSKPVYKLGETVVMILDFAGAVLPCYHVVANLETTEAIDSEIAHRSPQFNERATRKVYVQSSFSTIACQRASFSFCIPTTATPQFDTSYISSRWSIRIEFVTVPIEMPRALLPPMESAPPSTELRRPPPQRQSSSRTVSQGTIDIPDLSQTPPPVKTYRNGLPHTPPTPIHKRSSSLTPSQMSPLTSSPVHVQDSEGQSRPRVQAQPTSLSRALANLSFDDVEDEDDENTASQVQNLATIQAQRRASPTSILATTTKSDKPDILRMTHRDERGILYSTVEEIASETFECRLPIKVFPTNQDIAAMSFHTQPTGGYSI